ncbi:hypothetical protein JCM3766R1_003566 [Sporobolomyces carnicolor]
MPGKHDLSDDEQDQSSNAASSPKRARTTTTRSGESPLPDSTPPPQQEQDDEEDEEEEEDEVMSDIEEQDQAALDEMRATQQIKSTASSPSYTVLNQKIAEAGVITHVKLENFMCHYSTEVDFGPQVNFLVGVNGSGKSAVLTGITMALGGNAKATNRGAKGGDLIREGQPSAKCAVTLANRGEDAFKPDVYGEEITVERTINKAGGGAYKIKNDEGKTVDTKKSTLDAILDHFNLQVDNPMTVLTQDQSRQFLAKASARDKYNFFLRGTQLAQLTEEYEQIRANTETMEEALNRKREVIPELKEALNRAKARAREAQAAIEQEENLGKLQNRVIWSYVEEVEDKLDFALGAIQDEISRGTKFDRDIEKFQNELNEVHQEIETAKEAETESRIATEVKLPELQQLKEKIDANKARVQKWKDEERRMNGQLGRQRETLKDLAAKITAEEAKLSRDIEAERAPIRKAIEDATDQLSKLELQRRKLDDEQAESSAEYRRHSDAYQSITQQIGVARQQREQQTARRNHIQASQRNELMKYGNTMPQLVQAIKGDRSWRGKVVGPMGLHVKLNHPEYAKSLDSFFNHYLNGFVCEDDSDARRLRNMIRQYKLPNETMVLCLRYDDRFEADLVNGEPDGNILTVLRALTINDPLVRQALINANQLEKIALVPRRPDGDNLMRTDPRNVSRAFSADMYQLRHSGGRSSSSSMNDWKGPPRLQADPSHSIAAIEQEIRKIDADIQALEQQKVAAGRDAKAAETKRDSVFNNMRHLSQRKRQLDHIIAHNTELLTEEQPTNISALYSSKQEVEHELRNMEAQFAAGKEAKEAQDEDMKPTVESCTTLSREIAASQGLQAKIAAHLAEKYGTVRTVEMSLARAKRDKEAHARKVEDYQTEANSYRTTLEERLQQASSICERPERDPRAKRKTAEKLQLEIDAIKKALKEREKRSGATTDQIMEELAIRRKVAQDAVQQTNELGRLVNQLEEAYLSRTAKWTDFRAHICHRAKMQFGYYLSNRGFHGKLKFDHEQSQLHLAVQTDADKGKEKSRRKDAAALSGGEKSFSTICLLLTMWEAVGCPLRCLDEFDAVNRRIAMSMMVDTAKSADQTQFILITPQEMGSFVWGNEVKVVKMGDPKRNKGALAAGR